MNQTQTTTRPRPADVPRSKAHDCRGFSLAELMVALGVTLMIMAVSARMLSMTLSVRARENQRTEAVSDVQRALQAMSREIGNAGLGLKSNGLISYAATTDEPAKIRVRSNLNPFPPDGDADTDDTDEDVVFILVNDATVKPARRYIKRLDVSTKRATLLADRIDELQFEYLNDDGTAAATAADAERVRIVASVMLPALGSAGQAGYQPATRMSLQSEVTLRNRMLSK